MSANIIMNVKPAKIIHDGGGIPYTGEYTVTPSFEDNIVLATSGKQCTDDITILKAAADTYTGEYTVKSSPEGATVLATENKVCTHDITVEQFMLQEKTVTPSGTSQEIVADNEYDGLSKVAVEAAPLQTTTATPTDLQQVLTPDSPNIGFSSVTVEPIPPEYIIPSGTVNIADNGTHDVSSYAAATVNVPSDTQQVDAIVQGTITNLTSNATSVRASIFESQSSLRNVALPAATNIGDRAFYGCSNLQSFSAPNVEQIGSYAFYDCDNLTNINMQSVLSIDNYGFAECQYLSELNFPLLETIGEGTFNDCSRLTQINLPSLQTITGTQAFYRCSRLESAILPSLAARANYTFGLCSSLQRADFSAIDSIADYDFNGCSNFNTLILRNNSVVPLLNYTSLSLFNNTPFGNGGTGGAVYVPQALLSSYQSDVSWQALLSINANNQILQIEGSPYENQ